MTNETSEPRSLTALEQLQDNFARLSAREMHEFVSRLGHELDKQRERAHRGDRSLQTAELLSLSLESILPEAW